MKQFILFLIFGNILLTSCSSHSDIERVSIDPTPVYNNIESRMPGKLVVQNQYAIWSDPLNSDNQFHIVDLYVNKEIGKFGNIGNGPEEFVTPDFFVSSNNEIIVYDMNNDKMSVYSIDSINRGKKALVSFYKQKTKGFTRIIETESKQLIYFNPNNKKPFQTEKGDIFGEYPFNEKEEVQNNYNILQGNIAYNPDRKLFVYSTISFPYMAIYKKNKDKFDLIREYKEDISYSISEGKLILNKKKMGMMEITLTKDFIVALQRDYRYDQTDETKVGRDFNKLPHTLFVYDYKSNLKKIIDLKLPILRIASDSKNNMVYAITLNPDFMLVKFELS